MGCLFWPPGPRPYITVLRGFVATPIIRACPGPIVLTLLYLRDHHTSANHQPAVTKQLNCKACSGEEFGPGVPQVAQGTCRSLAYSQGD